MHEKAKTPPAPLAPPAGVKNFCPACNGSGYWDDTPAAPEVCAACGGVGWVWTTDAGSEAEKMPNRPRRAAG